MAARFLCLGALAVMASLSSAPAADLDADRVFGQVMRSQAIVVVSTADGPRVSPATCLDRDRGLFLADLDAVRPEEKAALVLPRFDKGGALVNAREDYLKWAAEQPTVPADQCVVHRDPKRCLAVLKFKDLPDGVRHLPLAAGVVKGQPALRVVVSRKIELMCGAMQADPRRVEATRTEPARGKEGPVLQVWYQSQQWGFEDSPGQAFVDANGRLAGVRLSPRLTPGIGTGADCVLDVREVAGMLKDAKITLPEPPAPNKK